MELRFNLNGKERKPLVEALSDLLGQDAKYLGAPTYGYQIGEYNVDRDGTLTGKDNIDLAAMLAERGFEPDAEIETATVTEEPETAAETATEAIETAEDTTGEPLAEEPADAPETAETADNTATDHLSLEYPLDGFTPEKLENLQKLVESKDILIKEALGVNELPIQILTDRITFPWFPIDGDGDTVTAYSQFICALCDTAKKKSRVVAKAQESFENPRFTMRVWLIGLGLIGKEFDLCRKLMMRGLDGNSGFRYGKPEDGAVSRKRDGIHRDVISIRLTPDTLEKLSLLAAKTERETGQRTSRNMLIEGAIEAYIREAVAILETLEPAAAPEAVEEHIAPDTTESETPESTERTEFTPEGETEMGGADDELSE